MLYIDRFQISFVGQKLIICFHEALGKLLWILVDYL